MDVTELNRNQLNELKMKLADDRAYEKGESISLGELIASHDKITDKEVYAHYAGIVFTEDDFFCSAG